MPHIKRKRPKIGDVFEIKTPKGFVYVQYSSNYSVYGSVIRVLPGLYPERLSLSEIRELVQQKERFVATFPVCFFLEEGWEAEIVAHEKVPEHARFVRMWRHTFPIGRGKNKWVLVVIDEKGQEDIRPATELNPEEFWKLPVAAIFHDDTLKEMLMDPEWTWEKEKMGATDPFTGEEPKMASDLELESEEEKSELESEEEKEEELGSKEENLPYVVHHYLYFPRKRQAEAFVREIQEKKKAYKVLIDKSGREYRVVTINWIFPEEFWDEVYELDEEFEELAEKHGGMLDGNEIGMIPGKDPLFGEEWKGEETAG